MTLETLVTPGDTNWFVRDRFGLFIHWGLYAMGSRHEWLKSRERFEDEEYDRRYFARFDPDLYDPEAWAEAARNAGMKYFVVTTKHHEGFCLWDSKLTDYKAPNTAAGRDLLRPLIEAFRSRGMGVGLYHSLIDWHHPHYVVDTRNHPGRERELAKLNEGRDQNKYADYLHGQVRELLTEYGQIDILWFDFSFPPLEGERTDFTLGKGHEAWRSEELYKMIRELQPNVILNDRLDLPEGWDVKTPEQTQPREWVTVDDKPVTWEACQTFSGSWGYHRDETSWKSTEQCVKMLIDTVSKGGNLLLNVGPTPRGEFDARALNRLQGLGDWMAKHDRSIDNCTQAPAEFPVPQDCRLTYNPDTHRMYVHIFSWPFAGKDFAAIHLDGFRDKVEYAQLLHDGSEIRISEPTRHVVAGTPAVQTEENTLVLFLPIHEPDVTVPVIELFLKS